MSIRRQVLFSLCGGFALFGVCIALTWLASDQFLAEGPDTGLAVLISYSWRWAYVGPLPIISPALANSLVIFFAIRAVAALKRKKPKSEGSAAP